MNTIPTPKQKERRERIEQAAYLVLKELGYKAASLLHVAQYAGVSNETLYRWYGNKQALFRSLVQRNASHAKALLTEALLSHEPPLATLNKLGPMLLTLVTSDAAIALNRAAASDVSESNTLGKEIASAGRETLAPLVRDVIEQAMQLELLIAPSAEFATETYFHLLIGDLQIRRAIGVKDELSDKEIKQRSTRALEQFSTIFAKQRNNT